VVRWYGALAVVIPAAVFARGLTGRFSSLNAGTAAVGFLLWEMVKIALTVAMMAAGAEAGGGTELAGIAGRPGPRDEGVLGGAGVRAAAQDEIELKETWLLKTWPRSTVRPRASTSSTT
jgi:hypothetical protein